MAYTVLNARVRQKLATDAYWRSIETELGVVLEGETVYVYNNAGVAVNFKIGDGTKLYSELPFFIAYFNGVTNCKVLSYVNQTGEVVIPVTFRNQSQLDKLILLNNSGVNVTVKVGISSGGNQITQIVLLPGINVLKLDYFFTNAQTVYVSAGTNFSLFVLYYQLDETPAVPTDSGGPSKKWIFGTLYEFLPCYTGHVTTAWDLATGLGRSGTDYEGAVLCGTNAIPDVSEAYTRGYKAGDTVGSLVGSNTKNIEFENLPELKTNLPSNSGPGGSGGLSYDRLLDTSVFAPIVDKDNNPYDGQTPFSVEPKSIIVLRFTGLPTT